MDKVGLLGSDRSLHTLRPAAAAGHRISGPAACRPRCVRPAGLVGLHPACPPTIGGVGRDDIFDALAAAFSAGEVEAARALFSEDYLDHQRPDGSDLVGPDEFTAVVADARHSLGELAVRVASPVTWAGELCVAVLAWRGRDRSGVVVERETVEALRLDATGKVAEHWGLEVRRRRAGPPAAGERG
jgi:hypothetical protein